MVVLSWWWVGCRRTELLTNFDANTKVCHHLGQNPTAAFWANRSEESAKPLCLDLCEHRLRNAEAGLSKLSDRGIEVDEPGLFTVTENRKRARDPQASPNGFLPASLFINDQHVGMYLRRERDRLAFSRIEPNRNQAGLRIDDVHPRRCIDGPLVDRFRRRGMLEFRQDCRWNENPLVQLVEQVNLSDQDEVVDRRRVCDNDYRRGSAQC